MCAVDGSESLQMVLTAGCKNANGGTDKGQEVKRKLVGARGFEPRTPCAQGRCATRLRYAPTPWKVPSIIADGAASVAGLVHLRQPAPGGIIPS